MVRWQESRKTKLGRYMRYSMRDDSQDHHERTIRGKYDILNIQFILMLHLVTLTAFLASLLFCRTRLCLTLAWDSLVPHSLIIFCSDYLSPTTTMSPAHRGLDHSPWIDQRSNSSKGIEGSAQTSSSRF